MIQTHHARAGIASTTPRIRAALVTFAPWLIPLGILVVENWVIFQDHYLNDVGFPWDFMMGYYAIPAFWTSALRQGIFPQWNPFQQMGFPFALVIQSGIYYPPLWMFPVLGIKYTLHAATVLQCLHILLGSIGMFVLARHIFGSFGLALVGAFAFQLFGGFYSNSEHTDIIRAFAFTPWLLYFFTLDLNAEFRLPRRALAIPAGIYLLATGGYPGNFFSSLLLLALYVLLQLAIWVRRGCGVLKCIRTALALLGLTVLGFSMSTVLYGPVLAASGHYARTAQAETLRRTALWIEQLPGLFLSSRTLPGEISMTSVFVGLPILVMASFISWRALKRHWIWAALAGTSILMVTGERSPLWQIVTAILVPLKMSRFPASDYKVLIAVPLILLAVASLKSIAENELSAKDLAARIGFVILWFSLGLHYVYPDFSQPDPINTSLIALVSVALLYFAWYKRIGLTYLVLTGVIMLMALDANLVLNDLGYTWRYPSVSTFYPKFGWPYLKDGDVAIMSALRNPPTTRPARMPPPVQHQFSWGGYVDGRYMVADLSPDLLVAAQQIEQRPLESQYMLREWTPLFVDPGYLQSGSRDIRLSGSQLAGYIEIADSTVRTGVEQTLYGVNDITYRVSLDEPRIMVENEIYYPGWTADLVSAGQRWRVDAISVNGILRAWMLPAGEYEMHAHFEFPFIWLYRSISLISLAVWIGLLSWAARWRVPAVASTPPKPVVAW